MKKLRCSLMLLSLLMLMPLITGCETRIDEDQMAEVLEIAEQIPFPDRYSQYDGTKLVPQDVKVKASDYDLYSGKLLYQFTCVYTNPESNFFSRGGSRNRAKVILIRDNLKWHSLDALKKYTEDYKWEGIWNSGWN